MKYQSTRLAASVALGTDFWTESREDQENNNNSVLGLSYLKYLFTLHPDGIPSGLRIFDRNEMIVLLHAENIVKQACMTVLLLMNHCTRFLVI